MKINIRKIALIAVLTSVFVRADAFAQQTLSEVALFQRCYAHLTQSRPKFSDPLLAQVKAGTKAAVQACTEILDKAQFTANSGTKIQDDTDIVAKSVLYSMHQLHRSWSREQKVFSLLDTEENVATEGWNEDSPYGAYVTRALFAPGKDVTSIISGTDFLTPVRTNMTPATYDNVPRSDFGNEASFQLGAQQPLAPQGELLGIRKISLSPVSVIPPERFTNLYYMPNFANLNVAPKATQTLTTINMADITAVRGPLVEIDQFAIDIKGNLQIPSAGDYTLYLSVDDAALMILDGAILIPEGSGSNLNKLVTLSAGAHSLEVQYRQYSGSARLIMSWKGPGIVKQVVPASAFSNLQAKYFTESAPPPIKLTGNEGGGFIGNHNYLLTTFMQGDLDYEPNGAERVNRTWARAVIRDSLCREVPVVRESDVAQFVVPASNTPFRQAATCSSCHASLDRQAGLIRGLRWNALRSESNDSPTPDLLGIIDFNVLVPTKPLSTAWSDIPDADYGDRPAFGHLYFRNYQGALIDRTVNSIEELGTAISEQDDYYLCFAKRYYRYFMGIEVELGDPGNVTYPQLNAADQYHRAKVIELGLRLKNSKNLRQLILDILGSTDYRKPDFGVSYQGPNP